MDYLIIAIAAIVVAVLIIGIYNSLVKLKNKAEEAWADIDTQLTRRFDLIPNLVETVKGYASHEKETLEKVTQARSMGINAKTIAEKETADNMLTDALKTIFALAENYPDLKANQNFLDLQKNLSEIEEHIQLSRRYYNATVRDLNTKIETFPSNFIAKMFSFGKREFFEATEEEKKNVKVSFTEETPAMPAASNPPATPSSPAPQEPKEAPFEEKPEEPKQ